MKTASTSARPPGDRRLILALALLLDLGAGEPPNALHPVAWLGRIIGQCQAQARPTGRRERARSELAWGVGIAAFTLALAALPAFTLERLAARWPRMARVLLLAAALKPCLAVRALFAAVGAVRGPLQASDLEAARAAAGRIVSRDVAGLDGALVSAAAIESLAENLCDSVVAPCAAFLLGGLPLAALYRAANTLDAMLGYRDAREYLGKPAAHLDDLLNLVPARLTALLLVGASAMVGARPRQVLAATRREQRKTASPNAGWPMAAAATALDRCLEKHGTYRINPAGRSPDALDIRRAERLAATALLLGASVVTAAWGAGRRGAAAPLRGATPCRSLLASPTVLILEATGG